MLDPSTLLKIENSRLQVRLSYVFQDDSGAKKGLTVAALLIESLSLPSVKVLTQSEAPPPVYSGDKLIGIVDPYANLWASTEFSLETPLDKTIYNSGILTRVFSLADDVNIDRVFVPTPPPKVATLSQCAGQAVHIIGESEIGIAIPETFYMTTENASIYPLYSIERSAEDLGRSDVPIRNGAMVTAPNGDLLGIIVSLYADNTRYGVAPIGDVIDWHKLSFLGSERTLRAVPDAGTMSQGDPAAHRAKGRQSQKSWDLQLQSLLEGESL